MELLPIARRLSAVHEPEGTVVTVTLDTSMSKLPPAARVFLRDEVIRPLTALPNGKSFQKIAERIERYVDGELRAATRGLLLVAGRSVWEAVEILAAVPNFVHVGPAPYVAPFLEVERRSPRAYVARFNMRTGLLQEFNLGAWRDLLQVKAEGLPPDFEHTISGRAVFRGAGRGLTSGIGGGKRDRFEQTLLEAAAAMVRGAARQVGAWDAKAPAEAFLVFGDREAFPEFHEHLPPSARPRALYVGPTPRKERDLQETASRELAKIVQDRRDREIFEFHERRAQGQLVALGPEEIWRQIDQGKVVRLFVDAYNPLPGARCTSCGTRYPGAPASCTACPGRLARVSLTQEIVGYALKHPSMDITFVPAPAKWLEEIGGMAALLSKKGVREAR